jgi:hypothetical protein
MPETDRLRGLIQPANDALAIALKEAGWGEGSVGLLVGLLQVAETGLLLLLLVSACELGQRLQRRGPAADRNVRIAFGFAAGALFAGSARFVTGDMESLFGRWDHFLFAAACGLGLRGLPERARHLAVAALSTYFLIALVGWRTMALLIGGGLLGYALLWLPGAHTPWGTAAGQTAVLGIILAALWLLRARYPIGALVAQGLYGFLLLRQISFAVEIRRGYPARVDHYLCYMLFYPTFAGATEIYSEFADRNFRAERPIPYRTAARQALWGQTLAWASFQIPITSVEAIAQPSAAAAWGSAFLLFTRSALFVMGLWWTIHATAWLLGFETRPNFVNLFGCENPAQFWRSWRATMTNWLIRYVYIPLGGNRGHQVRNICAAFVVSTAWHAMGIPFLARAPRLEHLTPILLWGVLNAAGVAGYVAVRRRGWKIMPEETPSWLRRGTKLALTLIFATFTVTLLNFRPGNIEQFVPFLRALAGLRETAP